jgi:hypothetical protein
MQRVTAELNQGAQAQLATTILGQVQPRPPMSPGAGAPGGMPGAGQPPVHPPMPMMPNGMGMMAHMTR